MKNKTKRFDKKSGKVENNSFYTRRHKTKEKELIADAKTEMFGDEAEYLDDDLGAKSND